MVWPLGKLMTLVFAVIACISASSGDCGLPQSDESQGSSRGFGQPHTTGRLADAKGRLRQIRVELARAPGMQEYFDVLGEVQLGPTEQAGLMLELLEMQEPVISIADLQSLFAAKRDSIDSFYCEYDLSNLAGRSKMTYAFDGYKLYWKANKPFGDQSTLDVMAYDGKLCRILNQTGDSPPRGQLLEDFLLEEFFLPDMPLNRAMVSDTRLTGIAADIIDFSKHVHPQLFSVFGSTYTINGIDCIAVSSSSSDIYLDLSKNFAVTRVDNYDLTYTDDGAVGSRSLRFRTTMSGLEDLGNGIWLPTRIEFVQFEPQEDTNGDSQEVRSVCIVEKMRINQAIPSSLFTDVFTENTRVQDGQLGIAYLHGDRNSIDDFLAREVQPKGGLGWFLWLNGAAVLTLLLLSVLRHPKLRRSKAASRSNEK